MSELVSSNAEGSKEEKRVEASSGSKVALAEYVSALAHAIHTLSMDKFVVLECHFMIDLNI